MEKFLGCNKDVRTKLEQYECEDLQNMQSYESLINTLKTTYLKPPEQSFRGIKKQKISEGNEEEPDSGVDATASTTPQENESSSQGNLRTARLAKTKANEHLKLPQLNTKLRQEIKIEPITEDVVSSSSSSLSKKNDLNSVNNNIEKKSLGIRSLGDRSGDNDTSVLIIPNLVNIITLSDEEDDVVDNKMPPPLHPAPKKLVQRATRSNRNKPPSSDDSLKTEGGSSENMILKSTKTKAKKTRKAVLPIKEEKLDLISTNEGHQTDLNSQENQNSQNINGNPVSSDVTLESLYEDATDKITIQPTNSLPTSSTFICEPTASKCANETFVSTNSTFSLDDNLQNGYTSDLPVAKPLAVSKTKISQSSIMTEDDSGDENLPEVVPNKPSNTKTSSVKPSSSKPLFIKPSSSKELFNPCIQSPLQMKVLAFERQAQEFSSPIIPIRQTRTKTRQLAKENAENTASKLPKPTTPSVEMRYQSKESTPLGLSTSKTSVFNVMRTQKMPTFNKPTSAPPLRIRSRDNSVEDFARSKEVLLEKKRRAEERTKRAQQQREAQEKEKKEKYLKALQEKQEKEEARKAMKALKEQQELRKQIKAAEQKRERELRMKAELAEAEKQEREKISQKIVAEKAQLSAIKMNRFEEVKSKYTFDMLLTDDSTDDEDAASSHRPSPPGWSLRCNRKGNMIVQAGVDPQYIDTFFSCQPTTPDLAAIFPQIDLKHLKRNSSAVWNTPPRYSQLPKY